MTKYEGSLVTHVSQRFVAHHGDALDFLREFQVESNISPRRARLPTFKIFHDEKQAKFAILGDYFLSVFELTSGDVNIPLTSTCKTPSDSMVLYFG